MAVECIGQCLVGNALARRQDMQPGVLRIVQKLTQRSQCLNIFCRRFACLDQGAGALAAGHHAHIAESLERLAHGIAADAKLLAQFQLRRQHAADRMAVVGDLSEQRVGHLLITQA